MSCQTLSLSLNLASQIQLVRSPCARAQRVATLIHRNVSPYMLCLLSSLLIYEIYFSYISYIHAFSYTSFAGQYNSKGREIARPMKIDGRKIKYVREVKYLGITLDYKLSWKPHISNTLENCSSLMGALIAKTRGLYGPKPKLMKWLYTGIIRPKITYGSIIWSHKINNRCYMKPLKQLNRIACTAATMIERTTPQASLELMTYIQPLDLHI